MNTHTYIIFFLNTLLEPLPLLCHRVLVLHMSSLGIQLGVIEETLRESLLGVLADTMCTEKYIILSCLLGAITDTKCREIGHTFIPLPTGVVCLFC